MPTCAWSASPPTTTGWWPAAPPAEPQVLVTDVRMPPSFRREGIDAAREVRSRFPGTGVVILSQYDDPEYAVSLLAAGLGRLRVPAQGPGRRGHPARRRDQGGGHRRHRARPGDRRGAGPPGACPRRADARPRSGCSAWSPRAGRSRRSRPCATVPPSVVDAEVEAVFVKLATGVSAGDQVALNRLRQLHQAIVDREEQGETLSRLLPSGLAVQAARLGAAHRRDRAGRRHRADERHQVVLDDRRARRPARSSPASSTPTGPR